MSCEDVRAALSSLEVCEETVEGSRVLTQVLYPSFDMVSVYVAKVGEGYKVHDAGGAFRSAWDHGRDESLIQRYINREAQRFTLEVSDGALVASVQSKDWLLSAILSVANASAAAANTAVSHFVAASEVDLAGRIFEVLTRSFSKDAVVKEFAAHGRSGKTHHFDFGVMGPHDGILLIDAVSPHHVSISAKYVSFADTVIEHGKKFAVHDRPLGQDDVSLLQQVADIVPFKALKIGAERAMATLT